MADPLDLRVPAQYRQDSASAQFFTAVVRALCSVKAVDPLDSTISNPPTQGEVQAVADKVDELIRAIRGL